MNLSQKCVDTLKRSAEYRRINYKKKLVKIIVASLLLGLSGAAQGGCGYAIESETLTLTK